MQPNRPTSVLVIAIFHFIFGGLGVCGGIYALATNVIALAKAPPPAGVQPAPGSPEDLEAKFAAAAPAYKAIGLATAGLSFLLSIVMIVAGVGLLKMQPWARLTSIGYAIVSIVFQLVSIYYYMAYLLPSMQAWAGSAMAAKGQPAQAAQAAQIVSGIFAAVGYLSVLGLIYPGVVLIFMLRPSVAAAFRGEGPGGEADDYGDRYDRGARASEAGGMPPGYGQEPTAGYEADDRIGPGPR